MTGINQSSRGSVLPAKTCQVETLRSPMRLVAGTDCLVLGNIDLSCVCKECSQSITLFHNKWCGTCSIRADGFDVSEGVCQTWLPDKTNQLLYTSTTRIGSCFSYLLKDFERPWNRDTPLSVQFNNVEKIANSCELSNQSVLKKRRIEKASH